MNVPHFSVGKYLCLVFVCSLVTLGFGCKVGGGVSHCGLGRHCYTECSGWW